MDNIDVLVSNVVSKTIFEPAEFEQAILTAFNKKENKKSIKSIIKTIITILMGLTITSGIVFAKDISNWIYKIFDPMTTSRGIISMAENGYIENTNMDYIKSNNIAVKIESIMMDDYNLDIIFDINFDNKIENCSTIEMTDLFITDEEKNIVFCDYSNVKEYEEYCKKNNIEYSTKNMHNNYTNAGYGVEVIEKEEHRVKFLYKMYSDGYPKSKKLYFKFKKIGIVSNDILNPKIYSGDWNIQINLPEQFYNREMINYTVKDKSDKKNNVIIKSAVGGNTEMHIDLTIKDVTPKKNMNVSENKQMEILEDYLENIDQYDLIQKPVLENEKGKQFGITVGGKEGNLAISNNFETGDINAQMCFDITKDEYTDNLKLILEVKEKKITINLSK